MKRLLLCAALAAVPAHAEAPTFRVRTMEAATLVLAAARPISRFSVVHIGTAMRGVLGDNFGRVQVRLDEPCTFIAIDTQGDVWLRLRINKLTTEWRTAPYYSGVAYTELRFLGSDDAWCTHNHTQDGTWCWKRGFRALIQDRNTVDRVIQAINYIHNTEPACRPGEPDFKQ